MAVRSRTRNRVTSTAPVFKSKSDWARALYSEGKTVAEVTKIIPNMGYAFAYGIAKRAGVNLTAASRKATRKVVTVGETVEVRTSAGVVIVHPDGKITRRKV